ncbi:MAG: surface-adhesin E family protein [Plesiomonas sp.]|uniref:surface-adhesin E family protein n=1 Tax=Plesiomonas sp. TaxID=2486279 RepID=UPI003F2C62B3
MLITLAHPFTVYTLAFVTSLVALTVQAAESDWKPVGNIPQGQVYLDTQTITTDEKGITYAKMRIDYTKPVAAGALSLVGQHSKVRINCAAQQSATDNIVAIQDNGQHFIMASYESAPFTAVVPETGNALLLNQLCTTPI